ncbi:hypothetical protein CKN60_04385 [Carnobacterium divergens]|uniref:Mga helix-turn-helix domain-containing protein n=2 Tax=Carnobacterium divergens TaxID=2748 RepID=A0A7Z8G536_CARDV|nr:hypothetical protein [Carnobacterium divergens]TFI74461.1 hypothetical protein CKN58_04345 [Carnobacterium divergens]TFI78783.1 hypothetical protein CKN85_04340 [Carnobacterium divergens]TFI85342.1 hypothetical protein CKN56_04315 [Carnobacterium divergens]TFI97698.1 hypothetical protein CKN64_04315 [Carnobacterium divergens]
MKGAIMKDFLNHEYVRKLVVLSFLNNYSKPVSIEKIAEKIGSTKFTVQSILDDLEYDLLNEKTLTLGKTVDKEYFLKTIELSQDVFLDRIHLNYAKKSVIFMMVDELFDKNGINTKKFCIENYISQATFSRSKQKLALIVEGCGLQLPSYSKNGIEGSEYRIRNFYFLFYWSFFNSVEWPFDVESYHKIASFIDKDESKLFANISKIQRNKIIYILYISLKRISLNNSLKEKPSKDLKEFPNYACFFNCMKNFFFEYGIKTPELLESEIHYLFFVFYDNKLIDFDEDILQYFTYMNKNNPTYGKISNFWINIFDDVFKLTLSQKQKIDLFHDINTLHAHCELVHCKQKYFYKNYIEENFYAYEKIELKLKKYVEKLFYRLDENTEYHNFRITYLKVLSDEDIINQYFVFIYHFLLLEMEMEVEPVVVYIENSLDYRVKEILEKKIERIFGNKISIIKTLTKHIDLFVTDHHIQGEDIRKEIFVPTFTDRKKFDLAVKAIQKLVSQKVVLSNHTKINHFFH